MFCPVLHTREQGLTRPHFRVAYTGGACSIHGGKGKTEMRVTLTRGADCNCTAALCLLGKNSGSGWYEVNPWYSVLIWYAFESERVAGVQISLSSDPGSQGYFKRFLCVLLILNQ